MGLEGAGISTYYSPGMPKDKIQLVQDFLTSQELGDQAYNTRLFEKGDMLELAIASSEVKTPAMHEFKGTKIQVLYGDHQPFMQALADNIQAAKASSKASSRLVVKLQLVVKLVVELTSP
jgi:hypothetical protein